MNLQRKTSLFNLTLVMVMCLILTVAVAAQVEKTTSTTEGMASKTVSVDRAEVISVAGNDLLVKMEDGQLRHIANVPESAQVTVDGKQLGIHDLKPGMKLERTITTTSTPKTITTVETVTGKVVHVSPPNSVILALENGENQQFKIPKGQKFMVDGNETDAFGLKKGMKVSATRITEVPETEIRHEKQLSGSMPPPPPAPPVGAPILIARAAPPTIPQAEEKTMPQTASPLPLLGLLGLLFIAWPLWLKWARH
jgi:hypothetical protein